MTNDVAIFLDLDNLVIGAKQANLSFDINLVLNCVKEMTNGRIVLRRSYGDWRQSQKLLEELTTAGFTTQSAVRINNFSKNLADMQIVVDTMDTLVDGHQYSTYVLMTGDRDFTPLVQSLRKRGKHVIGVGVKHTASRSFVDLCDQYVFYEDLVPAPKLTESQIESLLGQALDVLLVEEARVRASVLKQAMIDLSRGAFDKTEYGGGSFRKFFAHYPNLIKLEQEQSTTYVCRPQKQNQLMALHLRYRSGLKKQRLRIVPANIRFTILKDIIMRLQQNEDLRWRELIDMLHTVYGQNEHRISKNQINSVMLVARQAQVIRTLKGKTLSTAPVLLLLKGDKAFPEAIMRCDGAYLQGVLDLEEPFDLDEAAIALYDNPSHSRYLKIVMNKWVAQ